MLRCRLLWERLCRRCRTRAQTSEVERGGCSSADEFVFDGQNTDEEPEDDVGCTCLTTSDAVEYDACCALSVKLFQRAVLV